MNTPYLIELPSQSRFGAPFLLCALCVSGCTGMLGADLYMQYMHVSPKPMSVSATCPLPASTVQPVPEPTHAQIPTTLAPPPRPLRANVPHLWAQCILPAPEDESLSQVCDWDDGFPAISSDGTVIAVKEKTPESLGPAHGLRISWRNSQTGDLVHTSTIFTHAEAAKLMAAGDDYDRLDDIRQIFKNRIGQRVERVASKLNKQGFRSMALLAEHNLQLLNDRSGFIDDQSNRDVLIEAGTAAGEVRIVDRPSSVILWQGNFPLPTNTPRTCDYQPTTLSIWSHVVSGHSIALLTFDGATASCRDEDSYCPDLQTIQMLQIVR
jgi:hypothetical protein